jgi:xanthine dehydrogenase YagR molybdenum-binding subunit
MEQATVATFTGRARAFRAPGHPQGLFALEGAVDALAKAAGVDPLEFRLRNDPHPLRQVQWRLGAERIDWERKRREYPGGDAVRRGVGCAAGVWYQKGRGDFVVNLQVRKDGSVTVMNAVQDIGTGTRTVMAVLVAEELGIAPEQVTVMIGDTLHPAGPSSGGSTTAPSIGPAAREAGYRAQRRLAELLAEDWGCQADQVQLEGTRYAGADGKSASFAEACALIGNAGLSVSGQRRRNYDGFHGETAGCQFVEVAVDTETGVVRVERVVAVHDAGRIIDSLTARSQVVGGVIQGVSYALHEDRQMDRNLGDMVNPTFDTYRILGIGDCPQIDCVLTSIDSGFNNAGIMGLGEPVTVPTAGAVANAVSHALGVRMTEIPITPARVLAALGGAR